MRKPYRVIVWGPGGVGKAALRILHGRPDFEIVGCLCYSFGKGGVDIGQYIGKDPLGIRISRDKDEVLSLDADVVLHTVQAPMNQEASDAEVIEVLESGKNVISANSFNHPHYHGDDYVAKLEKACKKGKASLHGSGEMPGFFLDRMMLTMTGLAKEVHYLQIEEWFNISMYQISTMGFLGVNKTKEEARESVKLLQPGMLFAYGEALSLVCHAVWDEVPEVSFEADFELAEESLDLPRGQIQKGKVSDMKFIFTAKIDGKPRLKATLNWTFTKSERWLIEMEADPVSLRTEINGFASLENELAFRPGDTTRTGHYCTAMPLVQAIPAVVEAPPGIVYPTVFSNAMPDMRKLATRSSIAG